LSAPLKWFVLTFGAIITAIDPAIWICTHRLHHAFSDQSKDPHSPRFRPSLLQINNAHLEYYILLNNELKNPTSKYFEYIDDFGIQLHPLLRLPNIPLLRLSIGNVIIYTLHIFFYSVVYQYTSSILITMAIAAGLLGHPIQGTFVNYFGHIGNRFGGYRNFNTNDQSSNNKFVAFCIFGEGYQNNHHHDSGAINFAMKKGEFDFGYIVCLFLRKLKLVHF
jgi:stearoyl-CoA desaturase (delta-9 desaturase)